MLQFPANSQPSCRPATSCFLGSMGQTMLKVTSLYSVQKEEHRQPEMVLLRSGRQGTTSRLLLTVNIEIVSEFGHFVSRGSISQNGPCSSSGRVTS